MPGREHAWPFGPDAIVITGVGLVTAVGFDAVSTAVAIRAGVSRVRVVPDFITDTGAETTGGIASGLTEDQSGSERLLCLAIPALQEALEQAERQGDGLEAKRGALLLALPTEDRPAYEQFDAADLRQLLEGGQIEDIAQLQVVRGGHTAGLRAMAAAVDRLRRPDLAFAIVGGVDCLLELPALDWFDREQRLRTDEQGDGFIPGEAAAFVILERHADAQARGAKPLASITGLSFADEPAPQLSSRPSRGQGLSNALGSVLGRDPARIATIGAVLCDLNGESYRMREWALCLPRELPDWNGPGLCHPVEAHGDIGAASATALSALAVTLLDRRYVAPRSVLVTCSADDGDRGVLLLEASP